MNKDKYIVKVTLYGCDDETNVTLEMTQEQYSFLQEIEEKVNKASTYQCEPTMSVKHKAVKVSNE